MEAKVITVSNEDNGFRNFLIQFTPESDSEKSILEKYFANDRDLTVDEKYAINESLTNALHGFAIISDIRKLESYRIQVLAKRVSS